MKLRVCHYYLHENNLNMIHYSLYSGHARQTTVIGLTDKKCTSLNPYGFRIKAEMSSAMPVYLQTGRLLHLANYKHWLTSKRRGSMGILEVVYVLIKKNLVICILQSLPLFRSLLFTIV